MPGVSQVVFCAMELDKSDIAGRRILDVGSRDYNGSVRPLLEKWKPAEYIGVDVAPGASVDVVCSAEQLVERFGEDAFDVVLCVEMLEHAQQWRTCVSNMKRVLRPGGLLVITTRSRGYPCHGFPDDYWRYEVEDFRRIFSDLNILTLHNDPAEPGVFLSAKKPENWRELALEDIELFCILTNRREREIPVTLSSHRFYRRLRTKQQMRSVAWKGFQAAGRLVTRALAIGERR